MDVPGYAQEEAQAAIFRHRCLTALFGRPGSIQENYHFTVVEVLRLQVIPGRSNARTAGGKAVSRDAYLRKVRPFRYFKQYIEGTIKHQVSPKKGARILK